jgi:hypothetical protein
MAHGITYSYVEVEVLGLVVLMEQLEQALHFQALLMLPVLLQHIKYVVGQEQHKDQLYFKIIE